MATGVPIGMCVYIYTYNLHKRNYVIMYMYVISACPREHPAPLSTEHVQSTPQGIFSCRGKDARLFDIGMSC